MPDFTLRSSQPELMDDPAVSHDELREALRQIAIINRFLGGYPPSLRGIASLVPRNAESVDVLDVGAGAADVGRAVVRWARRRGLAMQWTSIDLSTSSVTYARKLCADYPEMNERTEDLFAVTGEDRFDIVHGSLVLHHFPGNDAVQALQAMSRLARWGVVINDLHRHPLAHGSIRCLTRALSRNRLIRNDAPLSVLRAFSRADWNQLAAAAGLSAPEVRWRWAFRWQSVFRSPPERDSTRERDPSRNEVT